MNSNFFGFNRRPFAAAPNSARYFPASVTESARTVLARCLDRAEGVAVLIGPAGTGKTQLLQVLADQFRNQYSVALLNNGRICTRRALLQSILFEQSLPCTARDEADLRLALVDQLSVEGHPGLLLLVDEAHTLPIRLLEEIRLLSNLAQNGEYKVRVLLSGGPSLEERLANPKLDALQQRITARCYLQAWNRLETREYVRAQIHLAGGVPEQVFASDALDAIHHAGDGIPRLINQVCDYALFLANESGKSPIKKEVIESAWADLQQLPSPQNVIYGAAERADSAMGNASSIVEFGTFDEQPVMEKSPLAKPSSTSSHRLVETGICDLDDSDETELRLIDENDEDGPRILSSSFDENDSVETNELESTLEIDDEPSVLFPVPATHANKKASGRAAPIGFGEIQDGLPQGLSTRSMMDSLSSIERQIHQLHNEYDSKNAQGGVQQPHIRNTASPSLQNGEVVGRQEHTISDPEEGIELSRSRNNPFAEDFLDEEVVIDPYLHDANQLFRNKPLVSSKMSRNLGDQLSQAAIGETEGPRIRIAQPKTGTEKHTAVSQVAAQPGMRATKPATSLAHHPLTAPSSPQPIAFDQNEIDLTESQVWTVSNLVSSNLAPSLPVQSDSSSSAHSASHPASTHSSDEVIVIEDDDRVDSQPPQAVRKEYKQLFQQLKKGQR